MDIAIALKVDSENPDVGDLLLENGTARLNANPKEEVAQYLRNAFLFFKGEWFLDPDQGVPWFQTILGQAVPFSLVSQILRSVLQGAPGVTEILSFSLTPLPDRQVRVDFAVKLAGGVTLKSSDFAPFIVGR